MSEKAIITDKDDNQICIRDRTDITADDIYRVSALWLTNNKGEILIAQRAFTKKKGGGRWGPAAAGTVKEGETYDQNIVKEIYEELGIKGLNFIVGPKFLHVSPNSKFWCQLYLAQADIKIEEFNISKEEVEMIKWIKKNELIKDVKINTDKYLGSFIETMLIIYPEFEYL